MSNQSPKKIHRKRDLKIPENLNINESQIELLYDVQYVLNLFSELKTRNEKLANDKERLKDELKRVHKTNRKLIDDVKSAEISKRNFQTQLTKMTEEHKTMQKEVINLRRRLESDRSEELAKKYTIACNTEFVRHNF